VLAASPRYCDAPKSLSAAQHDSLLRFGAVIRAELEKTGHQRGPAGPFGPGAGPLRPALFACRRGLKAGAEGTWAVRQLYYACEEGQPRLFDQGLPAFVLGGDEPELGYVSVLLLPPSRQALAATARDRRQALQLLSPSYSANAYPFSTLLPELQPVAGRDCWPLPGAACRRTSPGPPGPSPALAADPRL
jgi:hypothetical protein